MWYTNYTKIMTIFSKILNNNTILDKARQIFYFIIRKKKKKIKKDFGTSLDVAWITKCNYIWLDLLRSKHMNRLFKIPTVHLASYVFSQFFYFLFIWCITAATIKIQTSISSK